jgi:hypothetical protein
VAWWQEDLPHHAAMGEVAIHISNHTIHKGDRGLVVVGASAHLGELGDGLGAQPPLSRLHFLSPIPALLGSASEAEDRAGCGGRGLQATRCC